MPAGKNTGGGGWKSGGGSPRMGGGSKKKTNVVKIGTKKALTQKQVDALAQEQKTKRLNKSQFGPVAAGIVKPVGKAKPMSRAKKIATSRAAKDAKKVAKVAAPIGLGAAALKKANSDMNNDMKRMQELRKKYNQSPARTNMTFNDYVKRYGK